MARYWKFNENSCTFEKCDYQSALRADLPVIMNDDCDLYVVPDQGAGRGDVSGVVDIEATFLYLEQFEG